MRLIDADALKELRHDYIQGRLKFDGNEYDLIDKCPTIDAVPVVHARWDEDHKCTGCKKEALCEEKPDPYANGLLTLFYVDSNYCPNCGAKMDLEVDGDEP